MECALEGAIEQFHEQLSDAAVMIHGSLFTRPNFGPAFITPRTTSAHERNSYHSPGRFA